MPRTTPKLVSEIIQVDPSLQIAPFIRSASALVDWLAAEALTLAPPITVAESLLRELETWLAAHLYAHRDQLYTSKSTGGASASFQGQTGMYLESTQYGQTALLLDVTGLLAARNKGIVNRVQVAWLGKRRSERVDYDQRN
jgi:hypothetical protein